MMLLQRLGQAVLVRTPAKVNLHLEVLGKRDDGYHELATLMSAVSLYDTLELKDDPAGEIRLTCDQPALSTGADNLVCLAAQLLREHTGHRGGAAIRLWKRIPMAAGLAGGSSDAAATLAGLNALWRLRLPGRELAELGGRLGSDVPFFFATPAAWCTGRGERVEPLAMTRPLDLVLACPPVGLSTREVFDALKVPGEIKDGGALRKALADGDVETMGRCLHNRLQPVAERLCPAVASLMKHLASLGPAGQVMTGSGSTVLALCRHPVEAQSIARGLRARREVGPGTRVFIVRSCI